MIKNKTSESASDDGKRPAHEQVYHTLRSQILFGEMVPGQPVTIQGLTDSLGVGMTPVREAIRRLISDGALVFQGNRRVSVPVLSGEDIEQLIFARNAIESELSRRAALRMNKKEVDDLEAIDRNLDEAIDAGDVSGYLRQNYAFHAALYAHADAPVLSDLAERLWLRFGPSLRIVCGRFGTQSLPDRHKDIIRCLRNREADGVAEAMAQDVEQGMELMADVLAKRP
ncbi:GntR family transcriptional regulator [Ruegeria sediminis]|uniref:GntR family transcriptional regulator n=1 Tax=Ruegeria sediminis TaxID=2583820 RepID=A0ABY2WTY7_9RHOB|nr:GntR family transcriptional regulator [Ruegeria sediminis]TMV04987.1 GntR family transcriptional regulator [Ruegeria sediminis]